MGELDKLSIPEDLKQAIREMENRGIQLLRNGKYQDAKEVFSHEYDAFLEKQKDLDTRIHKGAPLHNLGLSYLFAGFPQDGLKFILLAYIEDVLGSCKKGVADNFPASIALRSICGIPPSLLRTLESVILEEVKSGKKFLFPEDNYSLFSPVIKEIQSIFGHLLKKVKLFELEVHAQKHMALGAFGDAVAIYEKWNSILLDYEKEINLRVHKGHPLYNIGVAIHSQGKSTDALRFFLLAYVEDTLSEYTQGAADSLPAFLTLKKGLGINTDLLRGIEETAFEIKAEKQVVNPEEILSTAKRNIDTEKQKLAQSLNEIVKSKEKNEKKLFSRLKKENPSDNIFHVLRRWNSSTPRYPTNLEGILKDKQGSLGGGYYLRWQGKGVVIDPGYDFLAIFFEEEFGLNHIDAIIATHAHDDHTQDIETIFSLIYKMNKKFGENRQIDFFSSEGVKIKYSRLLDVTNTIATDLTPGEKLNLQNYKLTIESIKTDHNEKPWMKNNTGVGFILELTAEGGVSTPFRMGITSDTKYWNGIENAFENLDLLVVHLGTINDPNSQHLQEEGCVNLLKATNPKLVVVSEFGEELVGKRCNICERISIFTNRLPQKNAKIAVIPGDIGLKINLPQMQIYCENTNAFEDYAKVASVELDGRIHYLEKTKIK